MKQILYNATLLSLGASYITTESLKVLSGERRQELQEKLRETNETRSQVIEENSKLRAEVKKKHLLVGIFSCLDSAIAAEALTATVQC